MKTKLSPYTIASNCTDLTDIRDGINEVRMFRHSSTPGCQNSRQRGKNLNRKTRFT